jgi:hypothetical protein
MADKCVTETAKEREKMVNELRKSIFGASHGYVKQAASARTLSYKESKQISQTANMMAAVYRKRKAGDTEASLVASLLFS